MRNLTPIGYSAAEDGEYSAEFLKGLSHYQERLDRREARLEKALATAPPQMTLSPKFSVALWKKTLRLNDNDFGGPVVRFAENWARIMESQVAMGKTIAQCARKARDLAVPDNLSGSQDGIAEGLLSEAWIHGAEFARWYRRQRSNL